MADNEQRVEEQQPLLGQQQEALNRKEIYRVILCTTSIEVLAIIVLFAIAVGSYAYSAEISKGLHSTYERLGHDSCPLGTDPVYPGYVVGFVMSENSTTFRCLPKEKEYVWYYDDKFSKFSNSQVEIQYARIARYRTFHTGKDSLYATCALCSVNSRINIQMFPATYKCPES